MAQRRNRRAAWLAVLAAAAAVGSAQAQGPVPQNSALDAPLFYQLLIGEMELRQGQPGNAFQVILDAARRTRDEQLFRRAVDIALEARAGDQALIASRAWQQAQPRSADALRMQLQILGAMNRSADAAEPLRELLALTPEAERGGLIAALPRYLQQGGGDRSRSAEVIDTLLEPYLKAPATRVASLVASGRAWAVAGQDERALQRAREAQALDAAAPGPVLLAMELVGKLPPAEALVQAYLARPDAEPAMRLSYARALMGGQRLVEALAQVERVTRDKPELPQPFLTLGALHLEMRHPVEAEQALQRYLQLAAAAETPTPPVTAPAAAEPVGDGVGGAGDENDDHSRPASRDQGTVQAWLMLAQAAEQRGDLPAAEGWLARIDDPARALEVQTRRATLLARQGRLAEAREMVRRAPERDAEDRRAKLLAEAGMLREVKQWAPAFELLGEAVQRFPDDDGLIYEQAMMAEKASRIDDMERLLRRVIELKPDNAHAYNALGYSLADRSQRLPEARDLIRRALDLQPGDPFITDSLGWVEFRLGNLDEAARLLRQAYGSRPDVEIGAHLGEVLWAQGRHEEARGIWRESQKRDAANEVLVETLARLKVGL